MSGRKAYARAIIEKRPGEADEPRISFEAGEKLGLTTVELSPMSSTLTRFIEDSIIPLGTIALPITLGQEL
ncbi:hypothetical protein BHM03_00022496 [Ensete ventricosum]|nr:hypothetical protein BHM03_00022496 [Ensete ventricosum]